MKYLGLVLTTLVLLTACSAQQLRDHRITRSHELFSSYDLDIQDKIRQGIIEIGFSPDMVMLAWGRPDEEKVRWTSEGELIVWTYTRSRTERETRDMNIPVEVTDSQGRKSIEYHDVEVDWDREEEYPVARVEFEDGEVTAFERFRR
ncbi:MAG: hypothetical protein JW937_01520 [Candidatus Omnitrophica bacterium]|nr:hypothetical protein [Candidatus Omnitrophota bacterium]